MSVTNIKISAITKNIAKLEQRKYMYEQMGDLTAATIAQLAIKIYTEDLDRLCNQ